MTVVFELDGQKFTERNGGPVFNFSELISFVTSARLRLRRITFGKSSVRGLEDALLYGWIKDRFDVSWQRSFHRYFRASAAAFCRVPYGGKISCD